MHTGLYTGDSGPSDQDLFIVEKKTFNSLCDFLVKACSSHWEPAPRRLRKFIQVWVVRNFAFGQCHAWFLCMLQHRRVTLLVLLFAAHDVMAQRRGPARGTLVDATW